MKSRKRAFHLQASWTENVKEGPRQFASGIVIVRDVGVNGAVQQAIRMVKEITVQRRETAYDVECAVTSITESVGFAGEPIGEAVKERVATVRTPSGEDDDGVELAPTEEEIDALRTTRDEEAA